MTVLTFRYKRLSPTHHSGRLSACRIFVISPINMNVMISGITITRDFTIHPKPIILNVAPRCEKVIPENNKYLQRSTCCKTDYPSDIISTVFAHVIVIKHEYSRMRFKVKLLRCSNFTYRLVCKHLVFSDCYIREHLQVFAAVYTLSLIVITQLKVL